MAGKQIGTAVLSAALLAGVGVSKQVERFTNWIYEETRDPITDAVSYSGWLMSRDDSPNRAGMVIGCGAPKAPLQIAVKFDRYLGGSGETRAFIYRPENWTAVTEQWRYVDGNVVGTAVPTEEGVNLRQALNTQGKFNVRAVTSAGLDVDASFDIDGAGGVVSRLLIDCKLDPRFP